MILKAVVQGISSIFFALAGVYVIVSTKIDPRVGDIFKKIYGSTLIFFGILNAIFMITLPAPTAWNAGKIALLSIAFLDCLFVGVYNLSVRQKTANTPEEKRAMRIGGVLLIVLALFPGFLLALSI